jgi:hypothetical protein
MPRPSSRLAGVMTKALLILAPRGTRIPPAAQKWPRTAHTNPSASFGCEFRVDIAGGRC